MADLGEFFDANSIPNFGPEFQELPDLPAITELKGYRQWVAWTWTRRETAAGFRWTKPPLNPASGRTASISNPVQWSSYERAALSVEQRELAGVGFVLTERDPFIGIDLDKCRNPASGVIEQWALDILALAETYAEVSPSETGIRLLARGGLEKATKWDAAHVEIYDRGRYVTITGRHIAGSPVEIGEAPKTIAALLARVAQFKADAEPPPSPQPMQTPAPRAPGTGRDFFRSVNDLALVNLEVWVPALFPGARGSGQKGYRITSRQLGRDLEEDLSITSQGAVDFGVHDMGDAREGKRTPIDLVLEHGGAPNATDAALWLCDRLHREPAELGWEDRDELARMGAEIAEGIEGARVAQVEAMQDRADAEDVFVAPLAEEAFPEHLTRVPGLVGEITDWIVETARRPSRVLALGAALTLVGTVSGRYWCGPTRTSQVLYVMAPAPSGAGKEHPIQCIKSILTAANLARCIGSSEFASGPAVVSLLRSTAVNICCLDEFGSFLKRVNNRKASGFEGQITKNLRELWGINTGQWRDMQRAQDAGATFFYPHLSVYATGVPDEIFAALEGGDVANGFVNRFIYMPVHSIPKRARPSSFREDVPPHIVDRVKATFAGGHELLVGQIYEGSTSLAFYPVDWADPSILNEMEALEDQMIALAAKDKVLGPFVARTAEMAVRLATVRAIGRNAMKPKIYRDDWEWGREVAVWSARQMGRACGLYIADTEAQADANRVLRIMRDLGGRATQRDIAQKLKHRMGARVMEDTMKSLLSSGALLEEPPEKPVGGGRPKKYFRLGAI